MSDAHIHQVLGGGLAVLALGNVLSFLRTAAAIGAIWVDARKLRENQRAIATKTGVELPHPPSDG